MAAYTTHSKKHKGVIVEISEHPVAFAAAFLGFFFILLAFFTAVDLLPEPITSVDTTNPNVIPVSGSEAQIPQNPEDAVRVVAKDIGLDTVVVNPASTDIEVLDKALESGAVHYPTSAPLGVDGTVLLFGHSSYLPVIYHQYYKTFVNIQNLKTGAVVSVYSGTTEYRYRVTGVRVADAADEDSNKIALPNDAKYLTLVTCDTFSKKSNRFVVTAAFEGAYPLQ